MSELNLCDLCIRPEGRGMEVLSFLLSDLRALQRTFEHDGSVPISIAQSVERNVLHLLDSISPEIRSVIAEFERYKAAPKIGGDQ